MKGKFLSLPKAHRHVPLPYALAVLDSHHPFKDLMGAPRQKESVLGILENPKKSCFFFMLQLIPLLLVLIQQGNTADLHEPSFYVFHEKNRIMGKTQITCLNFSLKTVQNNTSLV